MGASSFQKSMGQKQNPCNIDKSREEKESHTGFSDCAEGDPRPQSLPDIVRDTQTRHTETQTDDCLGSQLQIEVKVLKSSCSKAIQTNDRRRSKTCIDGKTRRTHKEDRSKVNKQSPQSQTNEKATNPFKSVTESGKENKKMIATVSSSKPFQTELTQNEPTQQRLVETWLKENMPWFTQIEPYTLVTEEMRYCLDPIVEAVLEQCAFYYPEYSMAEAKEKLRNSDTGTYLLRNSSQPEFAFALSVKTKRGTTSIRIKYVKGYFYFDCEEMSKSKIPMFKGVLELIEYFTSERKRAKSCVFLESNGRRDTHMLLSKPCYKRVLSLKDMCRRTLNGTLSVEKRSWLTEFYVNVDLVPYMQKYPYRL